MKRNLLLILMIFSGISFSLQAQSNLFIDQSYTVEEMVMDFFDSPGITISNVTSSGDSISMAFFDAGGTDLGLDAGIVFCNGLVENVIGPNMSNMVSFGLALPGDVDIDALGMETSNDAILIAFDFTVSESDTLDFNYVFGSEEYPEWVNTSFNDAFGFFISGPGISGPFTNGGENIALIPNTTEAVAINSVNEGMNSQFYVDNADGQHLEYDGLTTPLPASFIAVGGETYHVKIVVADRGDSALDSGIFLSFNSLNQDSLLTPPSGFQIVQNANTFNFINESKYARSWFWDFGNGQTSTERNPGPVTYASVGNYTVSLTTQNYCCTDTYTLEMNVSSIAISTFVETTNNPLNCFGDDNASIDLQISGGVAPFDIVWSPFINDMNNVAAGIYSYTVTDNEGTVVSGEVTIESPDEILVSVTSTDEYDLQNDGTASADAAGGSGALTYLWSTGATTPTIVNLPAGNYSVTITDANGCSKTIDIDINSVITPMSVTITTTNNPLACFDDNNATAEFEFQGGIAPYTYDFFPANTDFSNLVAGTYGVTATDAIGNTTSTEIIITQPTAIEVEMSSTDDGGGTEGTASAVVSGGTAPYEYLWSNGATTASIENLTGGDYTVTITDANSCTLESTVNVEWVFIDGINEKNDFTFKLFPNPVSDQLFLEWSETTQIEHLYVFDVLSHSIPITYSIQGNKVEVAFDHQLPTGVYHVQVTMEDGRKGVKRFLTK